MSTPVRIPLTLAQSAHLTRLNDVATQAQRVAHAAIATLCLGAEPPIDPSALASIAIDGDALVCTPYPTLTPPAPDPVDD